MQITFLPSRLSGEIQAPPSKSMALRFLLCAGLSGEPCVVRHLEASDDILAMLNCLRVLGVSWEWEDAGSSVRLIGAALERLVPEEPLPCNESGSVLRFLLPVCLLTGKPALLTGSPRLLARSLSPYEALCREQGFSFANDGKAVRVCGPLSGGRYAISGEGSSQFLSGLLFALAALGEDSEVRIDGSLNSRPYVDMTLDVLRTFGVHVRQKAESVYCIPVGRLKAPGSVTVEGDFSNAAFFEALNHIDSSNRVSVVGLPKQSLQGDAIYRDLFPLLATEAPTVSVAHCPDLAPVLMALAAVQNGATLTDTRRLNDKESDRGRAMAKELKKCGARIEVADDSIHVLPSKLSPPLEPLFGHNDHRLVMALAIVLTRYGGTLTGAEAVQKSFPSFFEKLKSLSADMI